MLINVKKQKTNLFDNLFGDPIALLDNMGVYTMGDMGDSTMSDSTMSAMSGKEQNND